MRIQQIRFKNLNSLAGEWIIDLTHPSFQSDGIFAITGPTGAGKTTILDAICLALYGQTPRLQKVTKTENEIMSVQRGECFAEVTFQSQKGRFRCHWSQHRARKKADGELQAAKHEIVDAHTDKIIESKIREVGRVIEEKTGMNFERFTRSMLLAQGGFSTFLHAAPGDKAPILEQITGTEIYSQISRKVHERHREEREKLKVLEAEIAGFQLLTPEAEQNIRQELSTKENKDRELIRKNEEVKGALLWLKGITDLGNDLKTVEEEITAFQNQEKEFEPLKEKLKKADLASEVESVYEKLQSLRENQNQDNLSLEKMIKEKPLKEEVFKEAEKEAEEAEKKLSLTKEHEKKEQETIKKVHLLDLKIEEADRNTQKLFAEQEELQQQCDVKEKAIKGEQEKIEGIDQKMKQVDEYLQKQSGDASLVTELTGIEQMVTNFRQVAERKKKLFDTISEIVQEKTGSQTKLEERKKGLSRCREQFSSFQKEVESLSSGLESLLKKRELSQWRKEREQLREKAQFLDNVLGLLKNKEEYDKKSLSEEKSLSALRTELEALNNILAKLGEEKEIKERDITHLEEKVILLNRIKDLEDQRKALEDEKPCPLCGSLDHPYAQGNVPEVDTTSVTLKKNKEELKELLSRISLSENQKTGMEKDREQAEKRIKDIAQRIQEEHVQYLDYLRRLEREDGESISSETVGKECSSVKENIATMTAIITQAEKLEEELKKATEREKKEEKALNQAEKDLQESKNLVAEAERNLKRTEKEHDEAKNEYEKLKRRIEDKVAVYGLKALSEEDMLTIVPSLDERRKSWEEKKAAKTELEKSLAATKAELEKMKALFIKNTEDLKAKKAFHEEAKKGLHTLKKERIGLYGDKQTEVEERLLEKAISQAEESLKNHQKKRDKDKSELQTVETRITALKETMNKRKADMGKNEKDFFHALKNTEFDTELEFQKARLSKEEREKLKTTQEALQTKRVELNTKKQERTQKLSVEREKKITPLPLEDLAKEQDSLSSELKALGQDIGALKQKLKNNEELIKGYREKVSACEARKKECGKWGALHELIGSAEGTKYRNFAQGLTFELMVSHANRQLTKMTDRYLLLHDPYKPLELHVIDNYQAGEIRSTKNLSGGEGFIVSLALALGLSSMASRNVRIDSLFLDEGFGTLDEEPLEMALETLSSLQQDGKLIGVISHVPALKERINTRIQVTPKTGGRSEISGPGCGEFSNLTLAIGDT